MITVKINDSGKCLVSKHNTSSIFVAISRAVHKWYGKNRFFYEKETINPLQRKGQIGHPIAPGIVTIDTDILSIEVD